MSIGIWQLVLILAIVFVFFGAGKLPQVVKDLTGGLKTLKKGLAEGDKEEKTAPAKLTKAKKKKKQKS